MRTVFAKILLWSFGTLLVSLAAYLFISNGLASRISGKGGPFERTIAFQVDQAEVTYRSGGAAALGAYLKKLQKYFGPEHFFTDPQGRDLVTGADRSALLAAAHGQNNAPHAQGDRFVMVVASQDGDYRLIATGRPPFTRWSFLPYYGLILVVVAVLCWMLAINIASPLRGLAHTVEQFGRGDLGVRANFRRRDEIGDVARAFDRMAGRIETLLAAERRLLLDISHELRSPLARLGVAVELARSGEDLDTAPNRIQKESDRLNSLVGQLLEVTRAEGDPHALRRNVVRLDLLVGQVVEDSQIEAAAHQCSLRYEKPGNVTVEGDPELLRRAIENVVRNAIRYSPHGSLVRVALESNGARAAVVVRDFGPGVPEEALPRLFDAFYRVDSDRDRASGGVGLGLSIARRAIEVHHGSMRARNAAPGLEVTIELPAHAEQTVAAS